MSAHLEAALRSVEAWSFETATDLSPAGYDEWAMLLHGPRKRMTREERWALGDEIGEMLEANRRNQRFVN